VCEKYFRTEIFPCTNVESQKHQYLRNVELQHCEYCINVAKYRFNAEKTLQKRRMSIECNDVLHTLQYLEILI